MATINASPKENEINRSGLLYTDKVVLITGGARGIGEGCTRVFVDACAKAVICDRDSDAGEALAGELTEEGPGSCHFEVGDTSKPDNVCRVIDRTIELYGRLDCLLNNAGYHPPHKPIDDFSVEELVDVVQTNLVGYFVAAKYALPHLRKTGGSIVNIGSLVASMGQEGATTYCATKGAVSSFTKALAIEEARHGVRVNCVLPGNIKSYGFKEFVAAQPAPDAMD